MYDIILCTAASVDAYMHIPAGIWVGMYATPHTTCAECVIRIPILCCSGPIMCPTVCHPRSRAQIQRYRVLDDVIPPAVWHSRCTVHAHWRAACRIRGKYIPGLRPLGMYYYTIIY